MSLSGQLDLLGDTLLPAAGPMAVVHVASHVRRSAGQRRAIGATPAPLPESLAERNRWVLERLEEWRKADHAASQQRSEGRKWNRQAEVCDGEGMFADEYTARGKAEACFALAGQHKARAAGLIAQITARVR